LRVISKVILLFEGDEYKNQTGIAASAFNYTSTTDNGFFN